ncbi:MAG: hypothetical protein U9R75_09930, partial [Candidatus Thermoplasmatota archaeon]|nr:hypothetical protein [Candidatus Thermoplasmatota archaeon]
DFIFTDNYEGEDDFDYNLIWKDIRDGDAPPEMIRDMFHNLWSWDNEHSDKSAYDIKNQSGNFGKYCAKFGYRVVDLDKESVKMDVPYYKDPSDYTSYQLMDQEYVAIKLLNFSWEEREDFSEVRLYFDTDDEWNGYVRLMQGRFSPSDILQNDTVELPSNFTGWYSFGLDSNAMINDDMLYFIVVCGSQNDQELKLINNEDRYTPMDYQYSYDGSNWMDAECQPAIQIISDKFSSNLYGDGLSNRDEYIIGTHPKKANTDKMIIGEDVYNDYLEDGEEIYAGGTSASHTKGGVIYRTNFDGGSDKFEVYSNSSGWMNYDWDGYGDADALNFTYSRTVVQPPADSPCAWDNLSLLFKLRDESGVFMDGSESHLYIWKGTNTIPDSKESSSGTKIIPGSVVIYNRSGLETSMDHQPKDRSREIYFSNPFEIDTDMDGIVDGSEIQAFNDTDSDKKCNLRDTDSDNDGILDRQEINWNGNNDTDNLENMIDADSDNDGLIDGKEVSWNFDTDDDGHENMVDPDSDGDGLPDGWMDGKIWDPVEEEFVNYSIFKSDYDDSNYTFPPGTSGQFDPWEGEDSNKNGVHDRDEPDPTKVDTDGDSLWDGFDVYGTPSNRTGLPQHYGELYFCSKELESEESHKGMPYSGGDYRRYGQISKNGVGSNTQSTNQVGADSDGDGLTDFEELIIWTLKVEDFIPPYNMSSSSYTDKL